MSYNYNYGPLGEFCEELEDMIPEDIAEADTECNNCQKNVCVDCYEDRECVVCADFICDECLKIVGICDSGSRYCGICKNKSTPLKRAERNLKTLNDNLREKLLEKDRLKRHLNAVRKAVEGISKKKAAAERKVQEIRRQAK